MIPVAPRYPDSFDGDDNLYLVHDSLRLTLSQDYLPGDTTIVADGDNAIIAKMPPTGQITLTEQCSEIELRAISFYYSNFDPSTVTFSGLTILPEFVDVKKPKGITHVTVNVMKDHHNTLKDTLIAIQKFSGKKGTEDRVPFGDTLEGRTNFLRRIVLQPKAWFTSNIQTGNVPLCVEFQNQSFRLGADGDAGPVTVTWDFGDHSSSTISLSTISATSQIPDYPVDVLVRDEYTGSIKKCFHEPGIYDVSLTVSNNFGSDTVIFPKFINARVKAPNKAIVNYVPNTTTQISTPGVPPGGPFSTVPKIRSPINTLIEMEIQSGQNPSTPGFSYAGEPLNSSLTPIDPISKYTWSLGDDLTHANSPMTKASYSVGGIYSMKLRVDTEFGSYRITSYDDSIDIIENKNLWLWISQDSISARAYEYGLISETFKLTPAASMPITRNSSFLNTRANNAQQIKEFKRNVGFNPRSNLGSGQKGSTLIYYATGRNESDPASSENINVIEYQGFSGTYITRPSIQRQWNWASLNSPSKTYFVYGDVPTRNPLTSITNPSTLALAMIDLTTSYTTLTESNYLNGASELQQNPTVYDTNGQSVYGDFSVYRTTWKDETGYIARNDGVGPFFRIRSFYRTEGTISNPFLNIRKLTDIQGPTKLEGQLVNMSAGIYMMNNSGLVSKFDETSQVWSTGGPGINSQLYRSLQDTSVQGFDDPSNTFLATSDSDKRAYLSFDYSPNAYIAFNEIDLTFRSLISRPAGEQLFMGIY